MILQRIPTSIPPSKEGGAANRFQADILIEIGAQWLLSLLHQPFLNVSILQHRGCRLCLCTCISRWKNLELVDVALGRPLTRLLLVVAVGDKHEEGAPGGGVVVWESRIHYALAAVRTGQVTRQTVHDHLVSKWECLLLCEHQPRCDILKRPLFSRTLELLWRPNPWWCGWVSPLLWLSLASTWAGYEWQWGLLRLAFNDSLQVPQLHFIQLLSLNWDCLIVNELVELTVLLEYHLRLAALVGGTRRILGLPYATTWSSTGNNCFFAIVNFRITLSWIEVATDLQLICLRYDSWVSFFSIDRLLLSLIHGGVALLNNTSIICPIYVDSRLLFLVYCLYGRGCCASSTLCLLFNGFVQSLLLFVLEQCLFVHLLFLFSHYR